MLQIENAREADGCENDEAFLWNVGKSDATF